MVGITVIYIQYPYFCRYIFVESNKNQRYEEHKIRVVVFNNSADH